MRMTKSRMSVSIPLEVEASVLPSVQEDQHKENRTKEGKRGQEGQGQEEG